MTRAALLDVVYRFYPRGLWNADPAYTASEERRRLADAARRAVAAYPTWRAMLRRLGARYPVQDESVSLLAGGVEPAYSAYLILPGGTLGFHVFQPDEAHRITSAVLLPPEQRPKVTELKSSIVDVTTVAASRHARTRRGSTGG